MRRRGAADERVWSAGATTSSSTPGRRPRGRREVRPWWRRIS